MTFNGHVTAVGWEPISSGKSHELYALVRIRLRLVRASSTAEKRLKELETELLSKDVVVVV